MSNRVGTSRALRIIRRPMKELIKTLEKSEKVADYTLSQLDDEMRHGIGQIRYRLIKLHDNLPESFQGKTSDIMADLSQLVRLTAILRARHAVVSEPSEKILEKEVIAEVKDRVPALVERVKDSPDLAAAMLEIEQEAHDGPANFRDFLKGLLMWKESPQEHLDRKNRSRN